MITSGQYQTLAGATAPANFATLLPQVIARLEAALGRPLTSAQRSELVSYYRDGHVYPRATPVTAVSDGFDFDTATIYLGHRIAPGTTTVTYTGGYASYGSTAANACPYDLALSIALGIKTLGDPQGAVVGSGVTSLAIAGEWSVSKAAGVVIGADGYAVPTALAQLADLGGQCATLAAKYRRVS